MERELLALAQICEGLQVLHSCHKAWPVTIALLKHIARAKYAREIFEERQGASLHNCQAPLRPVQLRTRARSFHRRVQCRGRIVGAPGASGRAHRSPDGCGSGCEV